MPPRRQTLILLFVVGCFAALAQTAIFQDARLGDGYEPLAVARSLATGQGFGNPYAVLATGPTAHTPPGYPWIVAAFMMVFGTDSTELQVALLLFHLALHGLAAALMPVVAERLLGSWKPGLWAAAGLIFLPLIPVTLRNEVIVHLVLVQLCLLVPVGPRSAVPGALVGAFTLHLNPSTLFVLAGWLVWRKPPRRWMAVYAATFVVACVPWVARNSLVMGAPVFIRDNLGLELYSSNNNIADALNERNVRAVQTMQPNAGQAEAEDVRRLGEVAYMKDRQHRALVWIEAHPWRFVSLTLQRIRYYWLPVIDRRPWQGWLLCLLTVAAIPGFVRQWRHPVFFAALLVTPLTYYLVQADPRFRFPYLWATLLLIRKP